MCKQRAEQRAQRTAEQRAPVAGLTCWGRKKVVSQSRAGRGGQQQSLEMDDTRAVCVCVAMRK